MFQTPYLVINSAKVAFDLLEKRSNIYSDRPVSCMATELYFLHLLLFYGVVADKDLIQNRMGILFFAITV